MLWLASRVRRFKQIRPKKFELSQKGRLTSTWSGKQHEPLNILFCGADEFSIYSLRALRALQEKRPEKIAGIDVVCRPDKYVGRGLKKIHEG